MSYGQGPIGIKLLRVTKGPLQPQAKALLDSDPNTISDSEQATILAERLASGSAATPSGDQPKAQLSHPLENPNPSGLLELPQTFGPLHLGEGFQSYVSVNNLTQQQMTSVYFKVELENKRSKASLYNTSKSGPISLPANGQHDFLIRHEVKDIGQHLLTCTVAYTLPAEEQRTFSQLYNFVSENPLSVRTKWRIVKQDIILEASVENISKVPMIMDYVRLDPAAPYKSQAITLEEPRRNAGSNPQELSVQDLKIISPAGGALNLLFRLTKEADAKPESKVLGKLDIKWRNSLGEVGRLQTQPISMTGAASKDITIEIAQLDPGLRVEQIFTAKLKVNNQLERRLRDLSIKCSAGDGDDIIALGSAEHTLADIPAHSMVEVGLDFFPRKVGMLKLPRLDLIESGAQTALTSLDASIFVQG